MTGVGGGTRLDLVPPLISPLLLERVDRAQPGTGVEGTPENEEWAPMNAPPPGGRLPPRGRWQGEALTDEGKNLSHSTKPGFIQ